MVSVPLVIQDPSPACLLGLLPHLSLVSYRVCPLNSGEDADTGDPEDTAAARVGRLGPVFPQSLSHHPCEHGCIGCHPCLLVHSPAKGPETTMQPPDAVRRSGGEQGGSSLAVESSGKRTCILKVEAKLVAHLTSSGPENSSFPCQPASMLYRSLGQHLLPDAPLLVTVPWQRLTLTLHWASCLLASQIGDLGSSMLQ